MNLKRKEERVGRRYNDRGRWGDGMYIRSDDIDVFIWRLEFYGGSVIIGYFAYGGNLWVGRDITKDRMKVIISCSDYVLVINYSLRGGSLQNTG